MSRDLVDTNVVISDVLVTGDKAFLGLDLVQPQIVTARQFIDEFAD